jgi:hypothetical protein
MGQEAPQCLDAFAPLAYAQGMQLKCPYCSNDIPSSDVNIKTSLGKCAGCHAVFSLAEQVEDGKPSDPPVRELELPGNFNLEYTGGGMLLSFRWKSAMIWGLVFFLVFWDGFLIVWYGIAFTQGAPLGAILFPLIHVSVGVGLTYYVFCAFINSTRIRFGHDNVTVRHGPLWWPGAKTVPREHIEQFFCEFSGMQVNDKNTYNVSLVLHGGKRISLVKYLSLPEHALFIEQEAEKALGIENRRVVGEIER